MQNQNVTTFILLGFRDLHSSRIILLPLLLVIYWSTLYVNAQIIFLVAWSKMLHRPMYLFLSQLSISDIILTTNIVPYMFDVVLNDGSIITLNGCLAQLGLFGSLEVFECLLLTVMSYDRFVAICKPLHYHSILNYKKCITLVGSCWFYSFSTVISEAVYFSSLQFCGSNIIDHFFCDGEPLLQLSCSDLYKVRVLESLLGSPVIVVSFLAIILSYFNIIKCILRIPSQSGRKKAFSTCSSHIAIVSIFFGSLTFLYVFPSKERSLAWNKFLSLLFTVVTPLLNPIIYCLRNKDLSEVFGKFVQTLKMKLPLPNK